MKTLVRIAIAVALLPAAASAEQTPIAQQKPNFSGRWAAVSPAKAAGQEQIVKHDDKTLSMTGKRMKPDGGTSDESMTDDRHRDEGSESRRDERRE